MTAPEPLVTDSETALAEGWHHAYEWQYGDCDHGTYSGGPSHGEPYEMCRIMARRLIEVGRVQVRADVVQQVFESGELWDVASAHIAKTRADVERAAKAEALRNMADEIDDGPTFSLPPSVISTLIRERAAAITDNGSGQ